MTRKQNDFIRMADAVLTLLSQHEPDWDANAPFRRNVDALRAAREAAADAGVGQQARSEGLTQDKEDLADEAIEHVVRLSGFAQAYALEEEDTVLYDSLQAYPSVLERMTDSELQDALTNLRQRIHALPKTAVRPYGITEAAEREMIGAIEAHKASLGTPRAAISERKVHTDGVARSVEAMQNTLLKLDKLAPAFHKSAPEFVSAYRSARDVISTGRRGEKPDAPDAPKA